MDNKEKVLYPLTIVAAVITIWAAFRKQTAVVVAAGGSNDFSLPNLAATGAQVIIPPAGTGVSFNYYQAASNDPLSANPDNAAGVSDGSTPNYLTYNTTEFTNADLEALIKGTPSLAPVANAGGCGCGGGSGRGSCSNGNVQPARLTDGRGACLSSQPLPATIPDAFVPAYGGGYIISSAMGVTE